MNYIYKRDVKNNLTPLVRVYNKEEHGISYRIIDKGVFWIVRKLQNAGFAAYIVGGALRDAILNRLPKDFDIVTNATPMQIHRIFRNSRIIGKRFTIVLVTLAPNHVVEVTTFRAANGRDDNNFGPIEEDILRRDFTCNGLYYCPVQEKLFDFVDGFQHILKKRLIPIHTKFREDPVRMIRAVKFSAQCNFSVSIKLKLQIRYHARYLQHVSYSRMTEEFMKILASQYRGDIIFRCYKYTLLKYMVPSVYAWCKKSRARFSMWLSFLSDESDDIRIKNKRILGIRNFIMQYIYEYKKKHDKKTIHIGRIMNEIKPWLHPLTCPNEEIRQAIKLSLHALKNKHLT